MQNEVGTNQEGVCVCVCVSMCLCPSREWLGRINQNKKKQISGQVRTRKTDYKDSSCSMGLNYWRCSLRKQEIDRHLTRNYMAYFQDPQRSAYGVAPARWGRGAHTGKVLSNFMHVCELSTCKNKDSAKDRERPSLLPRQDHHGLSLNPREQRSKLNLKNNAFFRYNQWAIQIVEHLENLVF